MRDLFFSPKYTIDTCSLNDLLQDDRKYTRKHFVSLWKNIGDLFNRGEIISHIEVYEEILNGKYADEIKWAKANKFIFKNYDLPAEAKFITQIGQQFETFVHQKKIKTIHADPWLVAQAKINNLTVISEELDDNSPLKIPTICKAFGIRCINLLGLIQEKNWKL